MNIAFHAPLKAPDHPVPSGDRRMARQLVACLERAGHRVAVVSDLRTYLRESDDTAGLARIEARAAEERARIAKDWRRAGAADLWVCYHPYYKAPDLIGPTLCAEFGVPYVTIESSYSARRNIGVWAGMQAAVRRGLAQAAVNVCLTDRDRAGILAEVSEARVARLRPFIDAAGIAVGQTEPGHLVCVAMMRPGDKWDSFRLLAAALVQVQDLPWVLSVAGDGALGPEVRALFAGLAPDRLRWLGQLDGAGVAALLARAAIHVWPGCGEAYGLAYLEAQAAGVPVVACRTAGVPEVVYDGETGLLVPEGDAAAFAAAVRRLLLDEGLRARMAGAARARVMGEHTIEAATARLDAILRAHVGGRA